MISYSKYLLHLDRRQPVQRGAKSNSRFQPLRRLLVDLLARHGVRRAEALEGFRDCEAALADAGQYLVQQQPVRVE